MSQISKIGIFISLILNGALVAYVVGIWPFLLFLSILVIIGLIWYIKQLLTRLNSIDEDFLDLYESLDSFGDHVETIHELEMFYGDETLQSLMNHSLELVNKITDYRQKYFFEDGTIADDLELELSSEEQEAEGYYLYDEQGAKQQFIPFTEPEAETQEKEEN